MTPAFSRDSRVKCLLQVSSVSPSAAAEAAVAFIDISRRCVFVDDIGQGGVFRQVLRGSLSGSSAPAASRTPTSAPNAAKVGAT